MCNHVKRTSYWTYIPRVFVISTYVFATAVLFTSYTSAHAQELCTVNILNEGRVYLDAFNANGTDTVSDTEAFKEALDCIETLAETADTEILTLYIGPGNYEIDTVVAKQFTDALTNHTLIIRGAGTTATKLFTTPENQDGILDLEFSTPDVRVTMADLKFEPGSLNAGTALRLHIPESPPTTDTEHQVILKDIVIHGSGSNIDFHSFRNGIVLHGAVNPLLEQVKISGPIGPHVNEDERWFTFDTNVKLENTHGATLRSVSVWSGERGIYFVNDDSYPTAGTPGVMINNSVSVHTNNGIIFEADDDMPQATIENSHVNSSHVGIKIDGPWPIQTDNNVYYYMYYGNGPTPYYNYMLSDGDAELSSINNTFNTPAQIDYGDVITYGIDGSHRIIANRNSFYHNAYLFTAEPDGSMVSLFKNNLFGKAKLYPDQVTPPSENPKVTIITPNDDTEYERYETVTIAWQDSVMTDETRYFINLTGEQLQDGTLQITDGAQRGQYLWRIPNDIADGQYSIRICRRGATSPFEDGRCDQSDRLFTIGGPKSVEPKVTVISPNGGEQYKFSDEIIVRWKDSVMSEAAGYFVNITGVNVPGGNQEISSSAQNGLYVYKIDRNDVPTAGKYSIRVCRRGYDGGGRCDQSDRLFTIGDNSSGNSSGISSVFETVLNILQYQSALLFPSMFPRQ